MAYIPPNGGQGGRIKFPAHVTPKMNQKDIKIVIDPSLHEE